MYCRVIACDYDGTGSSDGQGLAIELTSALRAAREQGAIILLVTGRVLDDLRLAGMDFSAFDGVVAENGAVVHLPALGPTDILGAPPAPAVLAALREQGVAFTAGAVVVATWEQHAGAARRLTSSGPAGSTPSWSSTARR